MGDEQSTEAVVDAIDAGFHAKRGGKPEREPGPLTAEQRAERVRQSEIARLDRAEKREETKRYAERYGTVKRTFLDEIENVQHGQTVDENERAAMADKLVEALGVTGDDVVKVRTMVDDVAEEMASGNKGVATFKAERAAAEIATTWQPTVTEAEDTRTTADVLAQIRR